MESELDVIDSLTAIAYKGKCLQNNVLTNALDGGLRSKDFREVVCWLTHELHVLRKTDEVVSKDVDDPNEFAMELSALLKELGCPFTQFVTGPLSERYETRQSRLELLEYLISELMATKMSLRLRPVENSYVISKFETNTARALEQLTRDLCMGKAPDNITSRQLFDKINFKIEELLRKIKPGVLNEPLLHTQNPLTEEQWQQLKAINEDLEAEYNMRRQVLLTRLEVTIQSFQWSESMKNRQNDIIGRFQRKMQELERYKQGGEDTNIVALLAARADLAIIEKTSSANVRKNTESKIQKHVIGSVPDRGGRANEHAPPPPEMPSWQQQRSTGPANRGGGGNFRGGQGGRGGGGGNNFRGNNSGNFSSGGGGGGGGFGRQQYSSQPYEQTRDQNWLVGSGRVQGAGWSQNQRNDYDQGGSNYKSNQGDDNARNTQHTYRGRSNYNRGGGGHRR